MSARSSQRVARAIDNGIVVGEIQPQRAVARDGIDRDRVGGAASPKREAIFPAAVSVFVRAKSAVSTPVTASENVTVKFTEAALVGLASARVMEATAGGVLSMS